MTNTHLLWPAAIQMLLTLLLFLPMAKLKRQAIADKAVDRAKAALDNNAWPEPVVRVSNNIQNQSQLPVLFYAAVLALAALDRPSAAAVAIAWMFVAARIVHSVVHIRTNYVPHRFGAFFISYLAMLALWAVLAFELVRG